MLCQAECDVTDCLEDVSGEARRTAGSGRRAERVYKEMYVGRREERAKILLSDLKRKLVGEKSWYYIGLCVNV